MSSDLFGAASSRSTSNNAMKLTSGLLSASPTARLLSEPLAAYCKRSSGRAKSRAPLNSNVRPPRVARAGELGVI